MNTALVLLRLRGRLLLRAALGSYSRSGRTAAPARLLFVLLAGGWLLVSVILPLTNRVGAAAVDIQGRATLSTTLVSSLSLIPAIIFFYSVLLLLGSFTYRNDLRLLLLTPAPVRLVLGMKIVVVLVGFMPILLLGVPGLFALDAGLHLGIAFDIAVLGMVILVPIAPVSLGTLLVAGLLHWLPPARARSISTVLGIVLGGMFFVGSQLLVNPVGGVQHTVISHPLPSWLPTAWPGHALAAIALGQWRSALLYMGAIVALAVFLFALATESITRVLTTGWGNFNEVQRGAKRSHIPRARQTSSRGFLAARLPVWWPILAKDWLTLRRDPQRLAGLVYPLLITGFSIVRTYLRHDGGADTQTSGLLLYGLIILVGVLMAGVVAATSINREGRALYLLGLAPLSRQSIFAAKWVFSVVPVAVLALGSLLAGGIILHLPTGQLLLVGAVVAVLTVAMVGAGLCVNLVWPHLGEEGGRRQGSLVASIVGYVVELVVAGSIGGLLFVALLVDHTAPRLALASTAGLFALATGFIAAGAMLGPRLLGRLLERGGR